MNPVLLLLAFLAISGVHAQKTQTLDPFSSINVCGSFDIGIQPSKDNTYSAELIGDESQFSSMKASVSDGVLSIENPGSINTQKGVAMIISAPSDVLKSIKTSGVGNVYVVPGFTADNFSLTTGMHLFLLAHSCVVWCLYIAQAFTTDSHFIGFRSQL